MCGVQVKEGARYEERRAEIDAFNARHPWVKRGISMTHCRWGAGLGRYVGLLRLSLARSDMCTLRGRAWQVLAFCMQHVGLCKTVQPFLHRESVWGWQTCCLL